MSFPQLSIFIFKWTSKADMCFGRQMCIYITKIICGCLVLIISIDDCNETHFSQSSFIYGLRTEQVYSEVAFVLSTLYTVYLMVMTIHML